MGRNFPSKTDKAHHLYHSLLLCAQAVTMKHHAEISKYTVNTDWHSTQSELAKY